MKDKRKIGIIVAVVTMLLTVLGVTYAFVSYAITGNENSVLVTGDIYMNYTENNQINLTDAVPMTKEDALKLSDNIFNFTIAGRNQSKKDIYYGISIVYGEEQESKTRLKDEDIDVYLTSGEDVLVNANRYKTLNDTRIWAEKIEANTENYSKDYSLRLWIDESVSIGSEDNNYTEDVWNNSYASFKVKVDGNLNKMNVPLNVDYQSSYYENGKTYFNVEISNYLNPNAEGIRLAAADTMKLDITKTNDNISFTYSDSEDNSSEVEVQSISQTYSFDTNKKVTMKVVINSNTDIDLKTDISIKLTKNENETYEILKYMHIRGPKNYCKNNGFTNFSDCLLVSEQLSNNVAEAKKAIGDKGEPDTNQTSGQTGDIGLYKTEDNDGDTYYYRGAVENNNVKFGDFYWKIIRINGDGSIRLIYNGTKPNSTDWDATSVTGKAEVYNERTDDPAYHGYMYGNNFSKTPITSQEANHTDIEADTKYWFAKEYTGDATARTFRLTNADYQGTFTEYNAAGKLEEGYKYTCKQTTADGTCQFLIEVVKFNSAKSIQAKYLSYSSTSYEATKENNASSNAKNVLENWYTETLSTKKEAGSNVTNYISTDATFCNDRSLAPREYGDKGDNGDGYSLFPNINYAAWSRVANDKTPTLVCSDVEHDLFSAETGSGKGNGKLDKPIGLITVDEVAFAGGVWETENSSNYLNTGRYYWTMTPIAFSSYSIYATMFHVRTNGILGSARAHSTVHGVRAVINLKKAVLLAGGNGTADDPYTVKLA